MDFVEFYNTASLTLIVAGAAVSGFLIGLLVGWRKSGDSQVSLFSSGNKQHMTTKKGNG